MARTLALESGDARFFLSVNQSGWCSLSLHIGDQVFELGADTVSKVKERLGRALRIPRDLGICVGKIDDRSVSWVMSLSEHHASIYAHLQSDGMILVFQDMDARTIAMISITDVQSVDWLNQLERL